MLKKFELLDGRSLWLQEILAGTDVDWWIVALPGSGAELFTLGWAAQRCLLGAQPWAHILAVNKPGISAKGRASREFERSFRRSTRIQDYIEVLKRRIPARAKIILVGFSEGGYLAPEIAMRDPRVKGITLISGGTRSWIDEEIFRAEDGEIEGVLRRVARIYARPRSTARNWFGISNAAWISYDTDASLRALEKLKIPVLALYGSEDRIIDLRSTLEDLRYLRDKKRMPIVPRVFEGVDHTFEGNWLKVMKETGRFAAAMAAR